MRHRIAGKKFNRDTNARKNLLSGLVRSLVEHGKIVTTQAKAKEVKRLADKLVSMAQGEDVAARRQLHKFFGKRDVVNTLVDRIAPLFTDRVSGFTTIKAAGVRRGDNTALFELSFIKMPEQNGTLSAPESVKTAGATARAAASKVKPEKTEVKKSKTVAKAKPAVKSAPKPKAKVIAKKTEKKTPKTATKKEAKK
ncbi:MAG: 50S ribosomal protein L17 [Microgenomates group bacterium]